MGPVVRATDAPLTFYRRAGMEFETGTSAYFAWPSAIAVDRWGSLYVLSELPQSGGPGGENFGGLLQRITPWGYVSSFLGAGVWRNTTDDPPLLVSKYGPLVVDDAGSLTFVVWPVARIDQVSRSGVRTTLAGSGIQGSEDGTGAAASFNNPLGIVVDGVRRLTARYDRW